MKKIITIVTLIAIALTPVTTASADTLDDDSLSIASATVPGRLYLWEHDHYSGNIDAWNYCNVDFRDNYYNSGLQTIDEHVSIWDNTIFHGDVKIATLYLNTRVPSFDRSNAADHATCLG